MSTNHPEKPFMTVVHGRENVLAAFATLEAAQADARLYWRAGDTLMPSTPVEVHAYNEVWGEWKKLFSIAPGSWELPWAEATPELVLSEEAQEAVTAALAPILDIHYPVVETFSPNHSVTLCAACYTDEGQDGAAAVTWPCPTAVAAGITAD